jgi:putative ABC transport system permease protein
MSISPIFILVRREIAREWARSLISSLSVTLGVALFVAADLLSNALTSEIEKTPEARAITGFLSEQLNVGLTAVSLVIAVGAGFIVFNTLSMAVAQRMADLGRLRAIGLTGKQAISSIMLEASLMGGIGAVLGIPAGMVISSGVMRFLETISSMFNRFGAPEISASRLALAAVLGVIIPIIAGVNPAKRASHVSPLVMMGRMQLDGDGNPRNVKIWISITLMVGILIYVLLFPPASWIEPPWDTRLLVILLIVWLTSFVIALPGWMEAFTIALKGVTEHSFGPSGLLGLRNSQRARHRVTYTVLTLAIGVAMIVGATGYMTYWFDELFSRTMEATLRDDGSVGVFPLDVEAGMQAYSMVEQFTMPQELVMELGEAVSGRAVFAEVYFVLIPELSFMGEDYFSFLLDPQDLWASRDLYFQFSRGTWEEALPLMEEGCGILMTPLVASHNNVGLYDSLWLETLHGPVGCIVAGLGSPMVGASIVSDSIAKDFGLTAPVSLIVLPYPETDLEGLMADMGGVLSRYEGVWLTDLSKIKEMQWEGMDSVKLMMSGMLVLAILGAALGVVSVLRMGFQERRREFALLRASGATRGQVRGMVLVEAGVIGLAGGCSGLILGLGLVLIYTLVVGGGFMGFMDFPVREAAFSTLRSAAWNGIMATVLSPLITVLVAWVVSRGFLKERLEGSLSVEHGLD